MTTIVLLISVFSLIIVRSINPEVFKFQLLWMIIGLAIFAVISRFDFRKLKPLWPVFYILSVVFLLIPFFGTEVRGAYRWINVFSRSVQPSEIVKPFLIMGLAGFLTSFEKFTFKKTMVFVILFFLPFFFVFKQPDLGNALVYLFFFLTLLVAGGFRVSYLLILTVIFSLSSPFLWRHLEDYQKLRLVTFLAPQLDIKGAGYNAFQALIAVGSGGLFGRGLGQGTQSRLRFLPEKHTDFIFASLVEELGFIGGLLLLFLYFILFLKIIKSLDENDKFAYLVSLGVLSQIFIQVLVNVGMNLGILPITGITLPLFSFGGSSILATYFSLGIISSFKEKKEETIAIG